MRRQAVRRLARKKLRDLGPLRLVEELVEVVGREKGHLFGPFKVEAFAEVFGAVQERGSARRDGLELRAGEPLREPFIWNSRS